jgi:putative SOS response-associated peptidase YedK
VCGRVVQARPIGELAETYDAWPDATAEAALRPRYNVAPTDPLAVVLLDASGRRRLTAHRWGLLAPSDPLGRGRPPIINARAETIRLNSLFRGAIEHRRCLIPVDGFYEWQRLPDRRQPWFIRPADGSSLALAGIWAPWTAAADGTLLGTCSIVTTAPLPEIAWLHDRMPLFIEAALWPAWLDPRTGRAAIDGLMRAPSGATLSPREVPLLVNNVRNDGPGLIAEVAA